MPPRAARSLTEQTETMTSELFRTPAGLLNEAARLRREAEAQHLTYPDREALLTRALHLEARAARHAPDEVKTPPPPLVPTHLGKQTPPPITPPKPVDITPLQSQGFAHRAAKLRAMADDLERAGGIQQAEKFRREARGWEKLSTGWMPPGWTIHGPKSKCSNKKKRDGKINIPMFTNESKILRLKGKILRIQCFCGKIAEKQISDLICILPNDATLMDAKEKLRCQRCRSRPSSLTVL